MEQNKNVSQSLSSYKRVLLTGGTGLVGTRLIERLVELGIDEISVLTRSPERAQEADNRLSTLPVTYFAWNPNEQSIDKRAFEGVDALIHLAGENVASGRWTESRKKSILESRVQGVKLLVQTMKELPADQRPKRFLSASAIGIYPDQEVSDEAPPEINEDHPQGNGFLAEVCKLWEQEVLNHGLDIKCSVIRIGVVLALEGGALNKMLLPFKMGGGGILANGKQYMSWIHLEDLVNMFAFVLGQTAPRQVYNGVAQEPVTNKVFTKTLGRVLRRPTLFPVPAFVLKIVLGELSGLLLGSQKIVPKAFLDDGFKFQFPTIDQALENLLPGCGKRSIRKLQWVNKSVDEIFPFFSDEKNLEKITPDYMSFVVLGKNTPNLQKGTLIDYKLRVRGIPMKWQSRIVEFVPNEYFVDDQLKGPYKKWYHKHLFIPTHRGTLMIDEVDYALPLGLLGDLVAGFLVKRDVETIFKYRASTIKNLYGS